MEQLKPIHEWQSPEIGDHGYMILEAMMLDSQLGTPGHGTLEDHEKYIDGMVADIIERMPSSAFPLEMLKKRANYLGVKMSAGVFTLIVSWTQTPGEISIWVHALSHIQAKLGSFVDMASLAQAMPNAFPSRKQLSEYWDYQKAQGGNVDMESNHPTMNGN